jgi:hypothetical protein
MKVKLVAATPQQFDWSCDLVRFTSTHATEHTSEVELTGISNTGSWTQLNWIADLSFTTPNVMTTLQLYNYAASQYPTSGDGYATDTIGQTDLTKVQTITATPPNFRDASGNWAMKIKGTKATDTPFDLQVDFIEFNPTSISAGNATVSTNVFNGAIGQISYELPYTDSPDTGLYLKGDSRTIANQSGSLITQLFIRSGVEHPEILLRYRPATSYATAGTEDSKAVNNLRIYVVNLNASDSISMYGEVPLRISCESTQMTTTTFEFSYNPGTLVVTSILDGAAGRVSIPISGTEFGAVVNVEVVTLNVKVARSVL